MPDSITSKAETIHGHRLRLFKDAETIQARVREIGNVLTQSHSGKHPIVLGLMQGSFVFVADLVRAIDLPARWIFGVLLPTGLKPRAVNPFVSSCRQP